jgi:cellulose synthase/poly-beta-1,6-N-acetylglucosamine synthase-like glycosyltransferase
MTAVKQEQTTPNPLTNAAGIEEPVSSESGAKSKNSAAFYIMALFFITLFGPYFLAWVAPHQNYLLARIFAYCVLGFAVFVTLIYTVRHYLFSINRLFSQQRQLYLDLSCAPWPKITVLVMAHNEEKVIEGSIRALLKTDYPAEQLTIMPVNDRSTDSTQRIIEQLAVEFPCIKPLHRTEGAGGKAAALQYASQFITDPIIVIFDADYLPGKGLLKQLVSPFFDTEVGATMGRVIPLNEQANLLTKILGLERCGGYQVNQQARQNMGLTAQFGGTVGGLRLSALQHIGGWSSNCLAEDTDVTFRMRCAGWKVVYQNRAECYEEVPEEWSVRIKQLRRWASGHHQVLLQQWRNVLRSERLSRRDKLDAFLILSIFMLSPIILLGWNSGIFLFYGGQSTLVAGLLGILMTIAYAGFGNFASFFEISAGAYLDRARVNLITLPFLTFNFLISIVEISGAILQQSWQSRKDQPVQWNKTVRYRKKV